MKELTTYSGPQVLDIKQYNDSVKTLLLRLYFKLAFLLKYWKLYVFSYSLVPVG